MADGVEINVGTGESKISGSRIDIGSVAGGNSSHDTASVEFARLDARVRKIEELLGGYLGIPGLTQEIIGLKDSVQGLKDSMQKTYVPPVQYVYMIVSSIFLLTSVFLFVFGGK